MRSELVRVKKRLEEKKWKGVVYSIGCTCGDEYIGETGRTLDIRLKEHKRAVQWGDKNNGISACQHRIDWDTVLTLLATTFIISNNRPLDKLRVVELWFPYFTPH